jgi:hypothetical protein
VESRQARDPRTAADERHDGRSDNRGGGEMPQHGSGHVGRAVADEAQQGRAARVLPRKAKEVQPRQLEGVLDTKPTGEGGVRRALPALQAPVTDGSHGEGRRVSRMTDQTALQGRGRSPSTVTVTSRITASSVGRLLAAARAWTQ